MKYYLINLIYLLTVLSRCVDKELIEIGLKNGQISDAPGAMVTVMTACALRNRIGQQPDEVCRIIRMLLSDVHKFVNSQNNQQQYVFHGKRGTGKTSAVKAIAEITNSPNKSIMTPALVNRMDNNGSEQINKIFKDALKQADAEGRSVIVFFDEIEALVSQCNSGNCTEHKNALESLCSWLKILKNDSRIIFIGATHTIQNLDQKFKNCIDKNFVEFPMPNREMREELIKFYLVKQGCRISSNEIYLLVKASEDLDYSNIEMCIQKVINQDPLKKLNIDTLCKVFNEQKNRKN